MFHQIYDLNNRDELVTALETLRQEGFHRMNGGFNTSETEFFTSVTEQIEYMLQFLDNFDDACETLVREIMWDNNELEAENQYLRESLLKIKHDVMSTIDSAIKVK